MISVGPIIPVESLCNFDLFPNSLIKNAHGNFFSEPFLFSARLLH